MVEGDKAEDEAIHAKYPERVCYVCGRTEEDLKIVFNEKIKEFDSRTKTFENEIKRLASEYREYLFKMLKDTEESNYLELKVETIKTDHSKFGKTIPRLDALLKFKENDKETLSEIRDRIEKAVENSDDFEICEAVVPPRGDGLPWVRRSEREKKEFEEFEEVIGNRGTINGMKVEIDKMRSGKEECELKEYTIDFEDIFMSGLSHYREDYDVLRSGGITVYICPICANMFSRASHAAYDVIHSGDNYD